MVRFIKNFLKNFKKFIRSKDSFSSFDIVLYPESKYFALFSFMPKAIKMKHRSVKINAKAVPISTYSFNFLCLKLRITFVL